MKRALFVLLFFAALSISAQLTGSKQFITPHVNPSLRFTENAGQWDEHILFRAQLDGGALFLEKDGLTFNFYDKKKFRQLHHGKGIKKETDLQVKGHAYKVKFLNGNALPQVQKQQEGTDYENFFLGSDEKKWKGNVKNYHQVWLRNIYNNIDYEVITAAQGIKYNFHVLPNADVSQIKLGYEGVEDLKLKQGRLVLKLNVNEVIEQKPYAYQLIKGLIKEVQCQYKLNNNILSFDFPQGYDKNYALVIDPVLVFAAQSGSNADNFGMTATYDTQGNFYAGGIVYSLGYPFTLGSYSNVFFGPAYYGNTDVVITKYNATGTGLLFSTYLGGNYTETVHSLIVDHNNNLCLYGVTSSTNFPTSQSAYDKTFNGGSFLMFVSNGMRFVNGTDIFVTKFNSAGSSLLASTYLGGSGNDGLNHTDHYNQFVVQATPPASGNITVFEPGYDTLQFNYGDQCRGEIMVDNTNNIYIASSTRSQNFPTVNGFDNSLGGKQDGIISKFNSGLTNLLTSSYIGGSSNDAGYGVLVTANQQMYVTGGTSSTNFPHCAGGYQSNYQGGIADGYVIRINTAGSQVLNGTFFGTSQYDQSYFIQTDKYQNIYIYGQSLGNIPVLMASNATSVFNVPGTHQFISRFNATLNQLNLSTVFGNYTTGLDISPSAFSVDKCNNIYISGWGGSILTQGPPLGNMPLLQPTQSTTDGFDFYFMGLDSNAAQLKYGSYFGGGLSQEHVDGGTSRFDPMGRIYQSVCAGCGGNDDFPVTPGAWPNTPNNPNHSTNCNNGVIKLDFQLQLTIATINTNTLAGCMPLTVTYTNATPASGPNASYTWYFGNGNTSSTILNPTITYNQPGTYTVSLVVHDASTCNKKDSSITFVTVYPRPQATIAVNSTNCNNTVALTQTVTGNFGTNPYLWNFGNGSPLTIVSNPSYSYPNSGNYNITFTVTDLNGCRDIKTTTVSIFNFTPGINISSDIICSGSSATLIGNGGTSYSWSPGSSLSGTSISIPVANPETTTIYSLIVSNNSPGYTCSKTLTLQLNVLPKPTVGFNVQGTPCTSSVTTANFSGGNLGPDPYSWNFGDGSPVVGGSEPLYSYSQSGIYNVNLTVTDINGCQAITSRTVAVNNFLPSVVNNATLCSGENRRLNAFGGTQYTWTPADFLNAANIADPVSQPSTNIVYTVNILNDLYGFTCTETLTTSILVNPTPTAAFIFTLNPCGGGVQFFDESDGEITEYLWKLESTVTKTVQHPYHFYSKGGSFTVELTTTNIFGCKSAMQKELNVEVPPPLSINGGTNICRGSDYRLMATGGTAYEWSPPSTLDHPGLSMPTATPLTHTEYSVNITTDKFVNGEACKFMLSTWLRVDVLSHTPVKATANPVRVNVGEPSTLTYLGDAGATVYWLPMNSTNPYNGYTVTTYPVKPTTYTVVAERGACRQPVEVYVEAYTAGCTEEDIFIPNTFTPNGDGENDLFKVRGIKVNEVYLAVYNRWGEMVYETSDRLQGWDGKYKGKDADVGVFGYYLKVKCINGAETMKKGNVTLVR